MQNKEKINGAISSKPFNSKYEQVRLLGEGSFGKAFLVESIEDKTLAVIKTIDLGNMTEEEKADSIQEGKILEQLDHPNIIKFREVYIEKNVNKQILHIVMDFADGGDLQQRIRSQKGKYFSENCILDWFTQTCLAIKHIHDRKILHRDIKSQNIFMTKNGLVKLGDFGIAKCLNMTIDKAKTIVGTPYYLSPEIVQNRPYSFKSDIWSLGVLLYEMCALKMPFDAQSLPLLSLKIIKCSYGPLPPNYSKDLRSLINTMLSVDINKRPSINQILGLPFIRSRIKSFLNEMEHNREFSHTILHNFNVFQNPKSDIMDYISGKEQVNIKESNNNLNLNKKENIKDKNYPKPVIKKDNVQQPNNNKYKKNFYSNNIAANNNKEEKEIVNVIINNKEKERERVREKEKELENINQLKRNLMVNNIVQNNQNVINANISNNNFNFNEKKQNAIAINPSIMNFNFDKDLPVPSSKPKVRSSIEIENKAPKIEKMPSLESKHSDKRIERKNESPGNINEIKRNLNNNNIIINNKKRESPKNNNNLINKEKENFKQKKSENTTVNSDKETVQVSYTDRKRSESRGSEEGREKNLKDFMKNMKEKIKNNPPATDGNVIWLKGMKEIVEKEIEREREKELNIFNRRESPSNFCVNYHALRENEYKSAPVNINKENYLYNNNNKGSYDNYANGKYKNTKDLEEYIESQKMLIELEKIKDGENLEENEEMEIYDYQLDNLKEFEDLNENDLILDNFIENNNDNYCKYEFNEYNKINSDLINPNDFPNFYSDNSLENNIKYELEIELGKDVFQKIYKILNDNLNVNILTYDFDAIYKKIKQECENYDDILLDLSLTRIPEIYCIIIKDRERKTI